MAESSMYHSEKNYSHFRNDNMLHIKTCLQSAHFCKHEDELTDFLTPTCLLGTLTYSHKNLSKCPNRLIVCNNTIKQFKISGRKKSHMQKNKNKHCWVWLFPLLTFINLHSLVSENAGNMSSYFWMESWALTKSTHMWQMQALKK